MKNKLNLIDEWLNILTCKEILYIIFKTILFQWKNRQNTKTGSSEQNKKYM